MTLYLLFLFFCVVETIALHVMNHSTSHHLNSNPAQAESSDKVSHLLVKGCCFSQDTLHFLYHPKSDWGCKTPIFNFTP